MWALALIGAWAQDCVNPPDDCDGDGWPAFQGDCDDSDPLVNPDRAERCDNTVDDNCDGFINEGCREDSQLGELGGGGGCGDRGAAAAWLGLGLPWLARRRR